MKLLVKVVGALAVVATSFIATLWFLDRNGPACPAGRIVYLDRPFAKFSPDGVAYVKDLTETDIPGDAADAPSRSRLVLCEDDYMIGAGHSVHADISKQGRGRYSHWGSSVVFSASDNSNPNTNGRSYVAVLPR